MNYTQKTIGFAPDLVPLVLDGSKTLTYRLGDKYDFLQIGDRILTDNSGTGKVFAELEITHKEKGTFGTLRDDREGHEMYRTPEERRATFEKYYKRPVSDDEPAIILGFKVVRKIDITPVEASKSLQLARQLLGKEVEITMDRPLGSKHPKHGFVYEANYGYIAGIKAPDGENLDAYYLGVKEPLQTAKGTCIAIAHRKDNDDDKLIVVPQGTTMTDDEIMTAVHFQEQWFDTEIVH